jgi:hypothetical protein
LGLLSTHPGLGHFRAFATGRFMAFHFVDFAPQAPQHRGRECFGQPQSVFKRRFAYPLGSGTPEFDTLELVRSIELASIAMPSLRTLAVHHNTPSLPVFMLSRMRAVIL